jgi:hypothetical protein
MNLSHGHRRAGNVTSEYSSWENMRQRCSNPKAHGYRYYGASGIKVCVRWNSFANFLADMGPKPEPKRLYSIDRFPDKQGDYRSGNCRWATVDQQIKNRRPYGKNAK